jgi:hypothetical protein
MHTPLCQLQLQECISQQTVAIANSNTGNFDFLSTLVAKVARGRVIEGLGLVIGSDKGV